MVVSSVLQKVLCFRVGLHLVHKIFRFRAIMGYKLNLSVRIFNTIVSKGKNFSRVEKLFCQ
jgi:hypothetical protein